MSACKRIGVAENGRPYCEHGPMANDGGKWACAVHKRARHAEWKRERYWSDPEFRDKVQERNERRLFVGDMYMGMVGFTQAEREAILNRVNE